MAVNRIVCCSDLRLRNVLIKVLTETAGIVPSGKGNTETAQRAYYAPRDGEGNH
jgi:hypothetical protein